MGSRISSVQGGVLCATARDRSHRQIRTVLKVRNAVARAKKTLKRSIMPAGSARMRNTRCRSFTAHRTGGQLNSIRNCRAQRADQFAGVTPLACFAGTAEIGSIDNLSPALNVRSAVLATKPVWYVGHSRGDLLIEAQELASMSEQCSGVISVPVLDEDAEGASDLTRPFRRLLREGYPLVFVEHRVPGCPAPLCAPDNYQAGMMATEFLVKSCNCTKVLVVPAPGSSAATERVQGHTKYMQERFMVRTSILSLQPNTSMISSERRGVVLRRERSCKLHPEASSLA